MFLFKNTKYFKDTVTLTHNITFMFLRHMTQQNPYYTSTIIKRQN